MVWTKYSIITSVLLSLTSGVPSPRFLLSKEGIPLLPCDPSVGDMGGRKLTIPCLLLLIDWDELLGDE
jgi:hypothetical protein